jgi:HEPN domain
MTTSSDPGLPADNECEDIESSAAAQRQRIRESIGYTVATQSADPSAWHGGALAFHDASLVLHASLDQISQGIRVFTLNAALSLELALKAILAAQGRQIPHTHDLRILADAADLLFTEAQCDTLELLTAAFLWVGRYPAPSKTKEWDRYHDHVLPKFRVHSRKRNVGRTMVDPRSFPTLDNYEAIWATCCDCYRRFCSS